MITFWTLNQMQIRDEYIDRSLKFSNVSLIMRKPCEIKSSANSFLEIIRTIQKSCS
jgi:hypothetical protein